MPGGSTMPTRRSRISDENFRARQRESASSSPRGIFLRESEWSATAVRKGARAQASISVPARCPRSSRRSEKSFPHSSSTAKRASCSDFSPARRPILNGFPNSIATGVREIRGNLPKNVFPRKLKIEPHKPSMPAGTTGTPALRAISSKPPRNACRLPLRVMQPSGKTQTSSPARSAAIAAFTPSFALSGAMGIVRSARMKSRETGLSSKPAQET